MFRRAASEETKVAGSGKRSALCFHLSRLRGRSTRSRSRMFPTSAKILIRPNSG